MLVYPFLRLQKILLNIIWIKQTQKNNFALRINEEKGTTTNDRRAFSIYNLIAMVNSPTKKHYLPLRSQRIKAMGFKKSSGFRLFEDADETRTKLLSTKIDENKIILSSVKSRKGYPKVFTDLRKNIWSY